MRVLSLFDGMSCGQIALAELGVVPEIYYASEVDKHAILQSSINFPNTFHLGSVTDVDVSRLEPIDLLIGGSPCLAGDTWVATDHGWKQLLHICPDDRVFDGVEWVSHQGIVSKGVKPCTSLFGVSITPDHLVYLGEDQWEPVEKLTIETHHRASSTAANLTYRKLPPPPEDLGYLPESAPIEVYDLLDAGPRSRFTIATNAGVLIVHNCQSFSFAGKRKGMATKCDMEILDLDTYLGLKAAGFEFEGQSYLFWEYVRVLEDIRKYNPGVRFLLENVKMGKKWEDVLSKAIGCRGIHINSNLVSAQNRKRIYWTNIEGITQPEDRGILLRDILQPEEEVDEKYYLRMTASGGNRSDMDLVCVSMVGRRADENGVRHDYDLSIPAVQRLEPRSDGKTNCLTSVQKDNLIAYGCDYRSDEGYRVRENGKSGTSGERARNDESCGQLVVRLTPNYMQIGGTSFDADNRFFFFPENKHGTLLSQGIKKTGAFLPRIRRLTPTECARLQTVPPWYLWVVSNTQQYKQLGNGWTIEVIKHILRGLT